MRVIRAADCRRMPWKNGGGETTEIAISPAGASLDSFDWRVSMARVEADGPFSLFAGIDRTLAALEGEGIMLHVEGRDAIRLTDQSEPLSFPADAATHATLLAGQISDLNVMSRRGRVKHSMTRLDVRERVKSATTADATLLFCQFGEARVVSEGQQCLLGRYDLVFFEQRDAVFTVEADPPAALWKIDISEGQSRIR